MESKKENIDALIKIAIAVFESNQAYLRAIGCGDAVDCPLNLSFFNSFWSANERKRYQEDLLALFNRKNDEFQMLFQEFCETYTVNKNHIYTKAQNNSDFYMALVVQIMIELKETQNYHFVLMGIPCNPENFSNNTTPLRYIGCIILSVALALFFVILPAILITQPFSMPLFFALFSIIGLLSIVIAYCGAMISENQVPFATQDPCIITQRFGAFEAIANEDDATFDPIEIY